MQSKYNQISFAVRTYRHLVNCKWGGRIHAAELIAGTKAKEMLIRCPACPQPGRNLPEDWRDAPESLKSVTSNMRSSSFILITLRYLYELFLSMDANFRLRLRKNKTKRNNNDPELGSGWACLVEENDYQLLIREHADDKDVSFHHHNLLDRSDPDQAFRMLFQHVEQSSTQSMLQTHVVVEKV
jgi:hypothetical protein